MNVYYTEMNLFLLLKRMGCDRQRKSGEHQMRTQKNDQVLEEGSFLIWSPMTSLVIVNKTIQNKTTHTCL